jgi:hypothetical protein
MNVVTVWATSRCVRRIDGNKRGISEIRFQLGELWVWADSRREARRELGAEIDRRSLWRKAKPRRRALKLRSIR